MLPKTIIEQIDKYRKHCLWRGFDINAKSPSKAAWTNGLPTKILGRVRCSLPQNQK
jgi:hypothetical protein